jgi:hypothetical protein
MAAGMARAAVIGHKGLNTPPLPWYPPPHPPANTGVTDVKDRRLATISITTIFLINPPLPLFT